MSPETTDAEADSAPDHKALPAVEASQSDQCEYVSVAETLVHSNVAEDAIAPDAAVAQETALRVVFEAALDVAASPGSPVCKATYTVVGIVHAVLPVVCSKIFNSA